MLWFQTKNKKLKRLINLKIKNSNINNFSVPVINLSSHVLTEQERNLLKYGFRYYFIDRHKNLRKSFRWSWNIGPTDFKLCRTRKIRALLRICTDVCWHISKQYIQLKRLQLSRFKIANQKQRCKSSTKW